MKCRSRIVCCLGQRFGFLIISLLCCMGVLAQTQSANFYSIQKQERQNRSSNNQLGSAVARSGNLIAVVPGVASRQVVIFREEGDDVEQIQVITAPNNFNYYGFGHKVKMQGEFLVISTYSSVFGPKNVRIYKLEGQVFELLQELNDGNHEFGFDFDLEDGTLVVGSPRDDKGSNGLEITDKGTVYVYKLVDGMFEMAQKLDASDTRQGDDFGRSVAIHGETIVVGAPNRDAGINKENVGAIYTFSSSGNVWMETQILECPSMVGSTGFGSELDFSNAALAVGASRDSYNADGFEYNEEAGAVYLFTLQASEWVYTQKVVAPDRKQESNFGSKIQVVDKEVFIGAKNDERTIFRLRMSEEKSKWFHFEPLGYQYAYVSSKFGSTFDFDGDKFVVGAPEDNYDKYENDYQYKSGSFYTGQLVDSEAIMVSPISDFVFCSHGVDELVDFNIFGADFENLSFNITSSNEDVIEAKDIHVTSNFELHLQYGGYVSGTSEISLEVIPATGKKEIIQFYISRDYKDYSNRGTIEICLGDSALIWGKYQKDIGVYYDTAFNYYGCEYYPYVDLKYRYDMDTAYQSVVLNTAVAQPDNDSYQWYNCDTGEKAAGLSRNFAYTALLPGYYQVRIANEDCSIRSNCVYLGPQIVSVEEVVTEPKISVNSIDRRVYIALPNTHQEGWNYEVYNLVGQKLAASILTTSSLDFNNLPKGTYVLQLQSPNKQAFSFRLVF